MLFVSEFDDEFEAVMMFLKLAEISSLHFSRSPIVNDVFPFLSRRVDLMCCFLRYLLADAAISIIVSVASSSFKSARPVTSMVFDSWCC